VPAKSQAQYRFLQAVIHNPALAAQHGLSQTQAKEYISKNVGALAPHNLPKISKMMKGAK
jgi:hypothetical protein